jgi:hypothetical protein
MNHGNEPESQGYPSSRGGPASTREPTPFGDRGGRPQSRSQQRETMEEARQARDPTACRSSSTSSSSVSSSRASAAPTPARPRKRTSSSASKSPRPSQELVINETRMKSFTHNSNPLRFLAMRFVRGSKKGSYKIAGNLASAFKEHGDLLERFGRCITGLILMRCIVLWEEVLFRQYVQDLMVRQMKVVDVTSFKLFYEFEQSGSNGRTTNPGISLWTYFKATLKDLVEAFTKEFTCCSSYLMGNYSRTPLHSVGVPPYLAEEATRNRACLLIAAGVKENEGRDEDGDSAEFSFVANPNYDGYFTYFFHILKVIFTILPLTKQY